MHPPVAARPSLATIVSRFLNRVRARGPGEACAAALGALKTRLSSQETLVFFERPTDADAAPAMDLREGTPADAERYAREVGTDSPSTFAARLNDATGCWLVEEEGRILHATWVTTGGAWTSELDLFFCPAPGSAYLYESYTHPEARGRGLFTAALKELSRRLGQRGIGAVWIGSSAENVGSLRAIAKAGFQERLRVGVRRRAFRRELDLPENATEMLRERC